jgi:uncharacterized protein
MPPCSERPEPNEFHADEVASILNVTRDWLERAVIGLNLCPFAQAVHTRKQIRWVVSAVSTEVDLSEVLAAELKLLNAADPTQIETTLLVHPAVLTDFLDYNQFLKQADRLLERANLRGILQIASFHPDYCFADAEPQAMSNYSNRSPYPLLHLLRESAVEQAVRSHPDTAQIYLRNIETLERLGPEGWSQL